MEIMEDDEETAMVKADAILGSLAFPMAMQAAVELGLFEIIAKKEKKSGAVTASDVAAELNTDNPLAADMVERILRLLAVKSVVSCSVDLETGIIVFGLTPVGRHFVKSEDSLSLLPLIKLLQDKIVMEGWYKLKDAVLEGGVAFDKVNGMNAFEYTRTDPRFNQVFNDAMSNYSPLVMTKILQSYKGFENVNQVVDVGGGIGHNLKIIMSNYPATLIKGINADLPHVIKDGISYPGMEHVAIDMFESVPQGEVMFMRWILHDWDDDHCFKLLKNCYKALPSNGKVVVVEAIMPDDCEPTTIATIACQKDLLMMTQNPGGRERTKKQFLTLAEGAGFNGIRFEACVCGLWVMEFYK